MYLSQQQLLRFDRLGQICSDLFGKPLSLATLQAVNQSAYTELENFEAQVKSALLDAPVLHHDAPEVPFINNQAEQDIRMIKLKQKISGSFLTFQGAQIFARIRGFFSTARTQGRNLLDSITQALQGNSFIPASPT